MSKRITTFAAFAADGTPVINVYGFHRKQVETLVADRVANGEAFAGERVVRIYITAYQCKLAECGLPAAPIN